MESPRHVRTTVALLAAAASMVAATALVASAAAPTVVGNPAAGKPLFVTSCGVCHTLKAAGTVGILGPSLNTLVLPESAIIAEITNGGASLVGKPIQGKSYSTAMISYKSQYSPAQIQDIAAFEYVSVSGSATTATKPSITSFTPASGKPGAKVTVNGANFTGATAVKIGGVTAAFTVGGATKITATVPANGRSGTISVTTSGGTATSTKSFTVS